MDHGIKSEKLRALFRSGQELKYPKNSTVIRAGEVPRGVYLIESGLIKVYSLSKQGVEHVHHFFGPGELFPIIWPFRRGSRRMYYVTLAPSTFLVVPKETFRTFVNANLEAMNDLVEELVDRYHLYTGRIDNLLYSDARERCAYRLLSLANSFGTKTKNGFVINALITHEDLAHSINMTRETFGRCVSRFQQKGIIGYDTEHHFIIKDLPALSTIIGKDETEAMWPQLMRRYVA